MSREHRQIIMANFCCLCSLRGVVERSKSVESYPTTKGSSSREANSTLQARIQSSECSEAFFVVGIRKRSQTNASWTSSGWLTAKASVATSSSVHGRYNVVRYIESLSSMAAFKVDRSSDYWMAKRKREAEFSRKPSPLPRSSLATKPLATSMSSRRCRRDGNCPSPP
ncbi:hypothetical protein C8F01DRAFT_1136757 [Mycena amicta]|nr:hypothetical protein C8F01DRAFT_1136757 [Mycena amicta]